MSELMLTILVVWGGLMVALSIVLLLVGKFNASLNIQFIVIAIMVGTLFLDSISGSPQTTDCECPKENMQ